MDIYKLIKSDHEKARKLLISLEKKKNLKKFEELKKEIYVHNEAEEEAFYTPLNSKLSKLKILIKNGHDEHDLMMKMMNKLSKVNSDEEWQALFSVIKKNLESHFLMEEEDLFNLSSKYFSDEETKIMASKMNKSKVKIEKSYMPQV